LTNKTQKFIEKARKQHGDKYDYSHVVYINNTTKVDIICPKHGIFKQQPRSHLRGSGCPKCSREVNYNSLVVYKELYNLHNGVYKYECNPIKNKNSLITVICPIHGKFQQKYALHLKGCGCPECGKSKTRKYTYNQFVEKSKEIYGDKYDYSEVIYNGNNTPITLIDKLSGERYIQTPQIHLKGHKPRKEYSKIQSGNMVLGLDEFVKRAKVIHGDKYDYSEVEYKHSKQKVKIVCPIHGNFYQIPAGHLNGKGCPKCGTHYSTQHEYIKQYLINNNISYVENDRFTISPLELDFYLPDYNLSIECNGIYWHSELAGKDRNYHINKTNLCKDRDIRLIHINENEFVINKNIILSKLNSLLKINKQKIYARKCIVREINNDMKSKFLDKYHLQGSDKSSVKLGLFYNNKLVSVMTFCKNRFNKRDKSGYELSRFCGNFNFYVVGGASKLFKYFERNYNPTRVVTYADKRWSVGDLYFKLGFIHTHDSDPNYRYFHKSDKYNTFSRIKFQKHKLISQLNKFDSTKTEWENMKENGWNRIWDCGNMVFEKNY
jgi:hypothetical protein